MSRSENVAQALKSVNLLPPQFGSTNPAPTLLAQGAEAILYKTHFLTPSHPCALKYRPPKEWRHPILDLRLTKHRIVCEARTLVKCRRDGVVVPAVLAMDWGGEVDGQARSGGWMMMEWIDGVTVRKALDLWMDGKTAEEERRKELESLMARIGQAIGKLHHIGVIHGDLTTSNLMLRPSRGSIIDQKNSTGDLKPSLEGEVVLIDFGLAAQNIQDEDKAVDLYVLERAYGSTHPTIEDAFQDALVAYGKSYKGANMVLRRLEDVRMRGRKRSMLG